MKNRLFFLVFVLGTVLAMSCLVEGAVLEWEIQPGERLEIMRTAEVDFFINRDKKKKYEERNIINLTCREKTPEGSVVKGNFTVFERNEENDVFKKIEQFTSEFLIRKDGSYVVEKKFYMPNLRHIPTFPSGDVEPGKRWSNSAELIFNNFSRPFMLSFPVNYSLKQIKDNEGSRIASIEFDFKFDRNFTGNQVPRDFPLRLFGTNRGTMLWDLRGKKPVLMDEQYHVIFLHSNKSSIAALELAMKIKTTFHTYLPVTLEKKREAVKEIEKDLPKDGGITVDQDERGLVLRLGDVLFDFDSYRLKGDAETSLERIAGIIREKYHDREVVVEGHTDSVGNEEYNMSLSELRSKSVAKYLKDRGGHDKLSYKGRGESDPIADNSTIEGRKKNRRVEIIIKLK